MTGPKLKLLRVRLGPIRGYKDSNLDLLNAPLSVGDTNAPMSGPKLKSHHPRVVLRVHLASTNKGGYEGGLEPKPCPTRTQRTTIRKGP